MSLAAAVSLAPHSVRKPPVSSTRSVLPAASRTVAVALTPSRGPCDASQTSTLQVPFLGSAGLAVPSGLETVLLVVGWGFFALVALGLLVLSLRAVDDGTVLEVLVPVLPDGLADVAGAEVLPETLSSSPAFLNCSRTVRWVSYALSVLSLDHLPPNTPLI